MTLTDIIRALGYDKNKKALVYYHVKILERSGLISPVKVERSGVAIRRKYYGLTPFSNVMIEYLADRKIAVSDDPISSTLLRAFKGDRTLYKLSIRLAIVSTIAYLITFTLRALYLMLFKGISYIILPLHDLLFVVYSALLPPVFVIFSLYLFVRLRSFLYERHNKKMNS